MIRCDFKCKNIFLLIVQFCKALYCYNVIAALSGRLYFIGSLVLQLYVRTYVCMCVSCNVQLLYNGKQDIRWMKFGEYLNKTRFSRTYLRFSRLKRK